MVKIRLNTNSHPVYFDAHERSDFDDGYFYTDDGQRFRKSALVEIVDPKHAKEKVYTTI